MFHLLKLREAGNKNSKGDQSRNAMKDTSKEKTTNLADKNKNSAEHNK